MISQEIVIQKILEYLNDQIELLTLAYWAEDALLTLSETDEDVSNDDILMDILGYIGAGDTPYFPLTWDVLSKFLEQLGARVRVTVEPIGN